MLYLDLWVLFLNFLFFNSNMVMGVPFYITIDHGFGLYSEFWSWILGTVGS